MEEMRSNLADEKARKKRRGKSTIRKSGSLPLKLLTLLVLSFLVGWLLLLPSFYFFSYVLLFSPFASEELKPHAKSSAGDPSVRLSAELASK